MIRISLNLTGDRVNFVVTQTSSDPPPLPGDFMNDDQSPSDGVFFLTLVTNLHSFEREILREGGH